MHHFPSPWQAPGALWDLESNCGPLVAWGVLRYLCKRVASARLLTACRNCPETGAWAIALALALQEHGLQVDFLEIKAVEQQ